MSYVTAITGPLPQRGSSQEDFSDKADILVSQLPAFQTQINTVTDEINILRDDTEGLKNDTVGIKDDVSLLKSDCIAIKESCDSVLLNTTEARDQTEIYRDSAQAIVASVGAEAGLPSLVGNSGKALAVRDDESGVEWKQFIKPDSMVTLTSGTSWTCPTDIRLIFIRLVGGSGGGGFSPSSNLACAGACGGYAEGYLVVAPGTIYTYTIGAGGLAGESSQYGNPGTSGGNTTITINGVTYRADGGSGGSHLSALSSGGGGEFVGGLVITGREGRAVPFNRGDYTLLGTRAGNGGMYNTGGVTIEPATSGDNGKIVMVLYK